MSFINCFFISTLICLTIIFSVRADSKKLLSEQHDNNYNAREYVSKKKWLGINPFQLENKRINKFTKFINASIPLYQNFRPPRQTKAQANRMKSINPSAAILSSKAKEWVLNYIGSNETRSILHSSLQHYTNEELLEMFTWEFKNLPLLHNAPASLLDAYEVRQLGDDSPLDVVLHNGYIQNVCHRYIFGGDDIEQKKKVIGYSFAFEKYFGMPKAHLNYTVQQANDCLLFNANNLRKQSIGTAFYGGFTYVLNAKTMKDRYFVEAWDLGAMIPFAYVYNLTLPGLGTINDFYHLVQPNSVFMNMPFPKEWHLPDIFKCCDYNIAQLFNRWWGPSDQLPNNGMLLAVPYYEIMAEGTPLIPEDLSYSIAIYANYSFLNKSFGLWGTKLGEQLQQFMIKQNRPLLWADAPNSAMIIDPIVGNIGGNRITEEDKEFFKKQWKKKATLVAFRRLAKQVSPYLLFNYISYLTRDICEPIEKASKNNVPIGIDNLNNCIYWEFNTPTEDKWECMNDGTCEKATVSNSERAIFTSEDECLAKCATAFRCVDNVLFAPSAKYCEPLLNPNDNSISPTTTIYPNINACEKECFA